jgi:pyruvate dehydrogenase E2 component (dihydrolipoamide acetyltransferase)
MRHVFKFPDIGEGIAEGKIIEWYVKKGEEIDFGDPIVKMETDKVVTDIPSPKDGVIVARYGKEGDVINVGDALVEIEIEGVEGEEAQEVANEVDDRSNSQTEAVEEKGFGVVGTIEVAGDNSFLPAGTEGRDEMPAKPETSKRVLATPVARKMAKDLGVDINDIKGSGPAGRVMKADIKKHHEIQLQGSKETKTQQIVEEPTERLVYEPMSQIRKAIARTMSISKHTAAHMTAMEEVEVSELIAVRNRYKDEFRAKGSRLTYLAFIMKAVAKALPEFPMLNAEADMENDRIVLKKYYDFNIAVDTPDGLTVPVIRGVDKKSIFELSQEIDSVAERARNRQLTMDDLKGGTFTITNYGALGGTYGVPVLNYPQVGILGIGRILNVPIVKDSQVVPGNMLPLSISVDHRIVDGGDTARFLNKVMGYLKDPVSLLLY